MYFIQSFETIGLLVQEMKRKIDFQDGGHGGHFGPDLNDLNYFWSTSCQGIFY